MCNHQTNNTATLLDFRQLHSFAFITGVETEIAIIMNLWNNELQTDLMSLVQWVIFDKTHTQKKN